MYSLFVMTCSIQEPAWFPTLKEGAVPLKESKSPSFLFLVAAIPQEQSAAMVPGPAALCCCHRAVVEDHPLGHQHLQMCP